MSQRSKNASIVYDNEFLDRYIRQSIQLGLDPQPKQEAALQVRALFNTIADCLSEGLAVSRQGFGQFDLRFRKSRNGRNPQTGAQIRLPEMISVGFRPGVRLRKMVNDPDNKALIMRQNGLGEGDK